MDMEFAPKRTNVSVLSLLHDHNWLTQLTCLCILIVSKAAISDNQWLFRLKFLNWIFFSHCYVFNGPFSWTNTLLNIQILRIRMLLKIFTFQSIPSQISDLLYYWQYGYWLCIYLHNTKMSYPLCPSYAHNYPFTVFPDWRSWINKKHKVGSSGS